MKFLFNITYQDKVNTIWKGVTMESSSKDFIIVIQEFNNKYPNCEIKGIVINEY